MNDTADREPGTATHTRSGAKLIGFALLCAVAFAGFIALGVWQIHRLSWKLNLIARVDARVHATPVSPPAPAAWPQVDAARDEYLRVALQGHYLPGHDTRVQAVTALGGGFWILSPFRLGNGAIVLVNRGFIPNQWQHPIPPGTATRVVGLIRMTEPGGGFLRGNDPVHNRWYSRDVAAIAKARDLHDVAPFFVDAQPAAGTAATAWPRAGLTVTHFPNNHLGYALTWFALALLVAGGGGWLAWDECRERRLRTR